VNGDGIIDTEITTHALGMMEIDEMGLDPADRQMLLSIIDNYGDNPVGLNTIAALTGDEAKYDRRFLRTVPSSDRIHRTDAARTARDHQGEAACRSRQTGGIGIE